MQPSDCRNCHGFPTLHKAEGHPQAASLQKKSASVPGRVLCKAGATALVFAVWTGWFAYRVGIPAVGLALVARLVG